MNKTPTLRIGEQFGRYEITDVLPAGGQGELYRAKHPGLQCDVAIKLLLHPEDHDLQRFEREAQTAAKFSHQNIVRVFDAGTQQHRGYALPYLVMEFIDGATLRERMREASKDQIIRWLIEVADGLAALHRRHVIHRDIKPANIMIGTDDHARIVDFGLAKTPGTTVTTTGNLVGTPNYCSPEQLEGRRSIDFRTDIFSFGIVMYEALTGRHPFRRATDLDTMRAIHLEYPDRLPDRLGEIVAQCLQKKPQDRYDDAADIARHLRELQPATPIAPPPAVLTAQEAVAVDPDATTVKAGQAAPLAPRFFSSRRWALFALVVALLLAGLLVVFKQQLQPDAARPRQASTAPTEQAQAAAPLAASALSGSPATIKFGESARLTWSSTRARDVVISPDVGIVGPNGSIDVSPLVTTSYEIVASNPGGDARASATIVVTDAPADFKPVHATGSIIATTDTIQPGGSTLLKWNSFGATSVVITPSIGIVPLQGSIQVAPKTTTTYTITFRNKAGAPARTSATVYVKDASASTQLPPSESAGITCVAATQPGVVSTLISDSTSCSVPAQQRVTQATLSYTLDDAGEISVNGRNVFTKAPGAGSRDGTVLLPMDLFVPGESFLVKVVARNAVNPDGTPAGELYGRAAVHIATTVPMAGAEMGVTPGVIRRGGTAHLDWSSVDAAAVVINPVIGVVSPKGRMTVAPTDTTTYTINAISASGDPATASVTLSVQ